MTSPSGDNRTTYALLLWLGVTVTIMASAYASPAASIAVGLLRHRLMFVYALVGPAILYLTYVGFLWWSWMVRSEASFPSSGSMLVMLMAYCVFVIVMTGGVKESPLVPFCGIVPIVAGRIYGVDVRCRLLGLYLSLAGIVGVLSLLGLVAPPQFYPAEGMWTLAGAPRWFHIDAGIAALSLVVAIAIEYGFCRMEQHLGPASVAVQGRSVAVDQQP